VNIFDGDALMNEMEINLNMLGTLMLDGVGGEVECADVIMIDEGSPRQGAVQLLKKLINPTRLYHAFDRGVVLLLGARRGDVVLVLGVLGDKVVTQKHYVA
jgi:hypothetical protein